MGKDALEKCYSALMQVDMNCSYSIAILFATDIPTFPGSLWIWVSPMSTNIRVLCYLLDFAETPSRHPLLFHWKGCKLQLTLTSGQLKAFKQHLARGGHSLLCFSLRPPGGDSICAHGWALLPLPCGGAM